MAEKDASKPVEPPKPVHIGGESLLDRLLPHMKQIIVAIVVVAAVLLVIFTIRWFRERGQIAATRKLDQILEVSREPIRPKPEKPDPQKPEPPPPGFGDAKERGGAVLAEIAKQGTDVAGHAFRGGQLLDAGKIDDAIAEYRQGAGDKTIEGVLCREGLGAALEAKALAEKDNAARQKGLEEALAAYAAMQPDENGLRHAHALYHQGRIQQLIGKRAEAKALFEKAKAAIKNDHDLAELVEKRLAALGAS
jgi:tetratricopeptide (TPR) repeat protein